MISLTCAYKKMVQMNLFTKQKQSHRCRKQNYGYEGRERGITGRLGLTYRHTTIYQIDK